MSRSDERWPADAEDDDFSWMDSEDDADTESAPKRRDRALEEKSWEAYFNETDGRDTFGWDRFGDRDKGGWGRRRRRSGDE